MLPGGVVRVALERCRRVDRGLVAAFAREPGEAGQVDEHDRGRFLRVGTFLPEDMHRLAGIALLTSVVIAVVVVSFTIWAASGAALARFVADERRRRIVSLVLAGLIVASVVLLWI